MTSIIIENGGNTDYISTLFVALFYKPIKLLDDILELKPNVSKFIYLQSLIKIKFVDELRSEKCIFKDVINEIRNYICIFYDFGKNNFYDRKNIYDFYNFILSNISFRQYCFNIELNKDSCITDYFEHKNFSLDNIIVFTIKRNENHKLDIWNILDNNWICQSIICEKDNHYYCIVRNKKKWLKFDDLTIPSIFEINLKDYEDDIKQECYMIIYKPIENRY